ncbi:Na/Pi cotransporter family protein [Thalassospira marina]|uniref:Na/Pi cotransporter n=1 Tax=Thalassospira marina TaxID=2048283 RepID=A0ABM6QE63_9PROT|nr:Na/Pi cotransporter family protein [Thalassospira marina]AUG54857.1 Na/Pi cotransporter [Thalassospira marina]
MEISLKLLEISGMIALLLWGVHMVQTGIQRAYGPELRRLLSSALPNRFWGFLAGIGVTAILQSSTATGLMATSFTSEGLISLVTALAIMSGANVGTTLIVQVLSFDITQIAPIFILIGVWMFRRGNITRTRDLGRVVIGLGLMLLSLELVHNAVVPYAEAQVFRTVLHAITAAPVLNVLLAAALTWLAHSSVAIVLLIMPFASAGIIPLDAAFALVLGANLGTAINPWLEGGSSSDPESKRLPLGNLFNRIAGCLIGLAVLEPAANYISVIIPDPAQAVAAYHLVFNLSLAVLTLPFLSFFARLLCHWLPVREGQADPTKPVYLEENARKSPPAAMAVAAREALRMADTLKQMLDGVGDALENGDRKRASETRRLDDILDHLNTAIKEYLTSLDAQTFDDRDDRRMREILIFTTNIEQAGDVIERDLVNLTSKRIKRRLSFSPEGQRELLDMLQRLESNLRSATAIFMNEDPRMARKLAKEKEMFRELEERTISAHFQRLQAGRQDSTETSTLHLDVVRDLKRINAHLVAAAAYPVLKGQGELLTSRLKLTKHS